MWFMAPRKKAKLAIITGTGFENPGGKWHKKCLITRFGMAKLLVGEINGERVVVLPRHGPKHTILPHRIKHRTNIAALEKMAAGVVSISAVGSLHPEKYDVGDIVTVRDFVDFWRQAPTIFSNFKTNPHTGMSGPYSHELITKIQEAAKRAGVPLKDGAVLTQTYGPRFETVAEVRALAAFADAVGMTTLSETELANELRIPNATLAIISNLGTGLARGGVDHNAVTKLVKQKEGDVQRVIFNLVAML